MANLDFAADRLVPGQTTRGLLRRGLDAILAVRSGIVREISAERREHRMRDALRGLDARMLRDIGVDRSGC